MSEQINVFLLLIVAANGGFIATLLFNKDQRTVANGILLFLIALLLLKLGFYITFEHNSNGLPSWASVPPLEVSLVFGPCIYLYLTYLVKRPSNRNDYIHFVPLLVQLSYYLVLHLLPPETASNWVLTHHLGWLSHFESLLTIVSLTAYLILSWDMFAAYQHWLDEHLSDAENYRLIWLRRMLGITSAYSVLWAIFTLSKVWIESSYESHFLLFTAQVLLLGFLSLESWRNYQMRYPRVYEYHLESNAIDSLEPQLSSANSASLSEAWYQQIIEQQCWKEPNLSLASLAARLGTDSDSLSFALSEGRQEDFNATINRIRVEYVCEQLLENQQQHAKPTDILTIALEAGFNSKINFERNFKRFTDTTPEDFLRGLSEES
ncbi:helix-turn-helix domain-containing protein [Aliiglaciecola litoralis]|uniref:AraC family transcriptional regulator n=1 Tax=Aliiglaciecola litoralis TaxID=582857 RepID=A0ABN1LH26_9ALTE